MKKITYRTYTIEKSGFNYRIRDHRGSYMAEIAATVRTAKKWIDAEIARLNAK